MIVKYLRVALGVVLLAGCARLPHAGGGSELQKHRLQQQLQALNERVDAEEAQRLASVAIDQALSLAKEYRVVRPPWLHNVLVNNGIRERGLCFEWTNDLFLRLYRLDCPTLEIHLAVARMDTRREHNALVVTARGAPFSTGVVLDGWRASGRLWFGAAATDKYPWVPLPSERVNSQLKEAIGSRSNPVGADPVVDW